MEESKMSKAVEFLNENPIQYLATVGRDGKRRCKRMGSAGDLRAYQCILSAEARCIDLLQRITSQVIVSVSCGSI